MLYVGMSMLLTVAVLDLLSAAAVRLPRNLLSVKMKTCQEMPSPRRHERLLFAQCPDRQNFSISGCIVCLHITPGV